MNKISIFLQCYNGQQFFKECLNSISAQISLFNKVYISISESNHQSDDIQAAQEFQKSNKESKTIIYSRNHSMSAIEHSKCFFKDILKDDSDSDFFLIMAHDDILLPQFSKVISNLINKNSITRESIVFPARSYYKDNFCDSNLIGKYFGLLSYRNCKITKEQFAKRCFDLYPPTNVTGMILSYECIKEYYSLENYFSYGYRAEYIMMFLKPIKFVIGTTEPLVGIRLHEGQEGSVSIPHLLEHDEILYRLYMLFTTQDSGFEKLLLNNLYIYTINLNNILFQIRLSIVFIFRYKKYKIGGLLLRKELYNLFIHMPYTLIIKIIVRVLKFLHLWELIKK